MQNEYGKECMSWYRRMCLRMFWIDGDLTTIMRFVLPLKFCKQIVVPSGLSWAERWYGDINLLSYTFWIQRYISLAVTLLYVKNHMTPRWYRLEASIKRTMPLTRSHAITNASGEPYDIISIFRNLCPLKEHGHISVQKKSYYTMSLSIRRLLYNNINSALKYR